MGKVLSSIRHRIQFAFFLLALVGVVSSVWNIYLLSGYEKHLELLSRDQVPSLVAAYEVARQGEAIAKGASGVVLTHDKWTRDAFVDRITDQFNWLNNQLKVLRKSSVNPELLGHIEANKIALKQSFRDLAKAVEQRNAIVTGRTPTYDRSAVDAKVERLLVLHKYHADRLTYAVAGLATTMTNDIEGSVALILKKMRKESLQLNVYAMASIAIAIFLILMLETKVTRRVVAIQKSMRAVADGNTKERIPSGGSDEISDMADALGTFVEKLNEREEKLQALVNARTQQLARVNIELHTSERRLRNLFEVASDWFWETDRDFNITYMSSQYYEMLGIDPPVWMPTIFEHMTRENIVADELTLGNFFEDLRKHRPFRHFEFAVRRANAQTMYIQSTGIPIFDEYGAFDGYRGAMTDVSESRRAENELRHAQKMQALGNLAGGVAHSFNNIFQPIMILSEITMEEMPEGSPVRERLKVAINACQRGKALGDRILLYSRQDEPRKTRVNIHELVRNTMELFHSSVPSTICLHDYIAHDAGEIIGDVAQIESLLLNMASNAIDAIGGEKGEITIILTRTLGRDVEFDTGGEVDKRAVYANISIKDTGCGMDKATLESIFDPFFTTKEVGKGTGLGLSLASGVATMHGGGIKVTSAPGRGSTFNVFLPLVDAKETTQVVKREDSTVREKAAHSNAKGTDHG